MAAFYLSAFPAMAADYSSELDSMWDFDRPAVSETRFRAEAARHPGASREAVEAATQVARTLSLQRRFVDADRVLDRIEIALAAQPPRVRVRYLLERGRRDNSSGNRERAVTWFERALAASADDTLPGSDYYRVDALHMLGIATPAERQLDWNLRALAAAEGSTDERTRVWRASLLNNIGWTMHDRGDYPAALGYWRQALAARESGQDAKATRIARWTVARGLRSVGRLDDAEAIQIALVHELDDAQAPDGYVYEELAEIAMARGDAATAGPWAAKALALLRNDAGFVASEPARIERLTQIAGSSAASPR